MLPAMHEPGAKKLVERESGDGSGIPGREEGRLRTGGTGGKGGKRGEQMEETKAGKPVVPATSEGVEFRLVFSFSAGTRLINPPCLSYRVSA